VSPTAAARETADLAAAALWAAVMGCAIGAGIGAWLIGEGVRRLVRR
jgi:hypothetical protein